MNAPKRQLIIPLAFLTLSACTESASRAAELGQLQLRGLTGVNVVVFIDREIDGFKALEASLLDDVNTTLVNGGLSSESGQDLTLSIDAKAYPTSSLTTTDVSLLTIRVRLREAVLLARDPALKIPGGNGAITWSREWTLLERTSDRSAAIKRETLSQVKDFVADVRSANR